MVWIAEMLDHGEARLLLNLMETHKSRKKNFLASKTYVDAGDLEVQELDVILK